MKIALNQYTPLEFEIRERIPMENLYTENKTRASRQASIGSDKPTLISLTLNFNPIWPRMDTLAYAALTLMLQGNKLTHPDFQKNTGSWRLAAHILILKNHGWPIKVQAIRGIRYGNFRARTICRYFLDSDFLKMFQCQGGAL